MSFSKLVQFLVINNRIKFGIYTSEQPSKILIVSTEKMRVVLAVGIFAFAIYFNSVGQ